MGRDTMAAIAAEIAPDLADLLDEAPAHRDEGPEIELHQGQAGRETLALIAEEMLHDGGPGATSSAPARERRHTLSYEEKPIAPVAPRVRMNTLDYAERAVATRRSPQGVGLGGELPMRPEPPAAPAPRAAAAAPQAPVLPATVPDEYEIHEMVTFVVRGDLAQLASTTARFDFVRDRLMHRLPVASISAVERIDVTPWTVRGTVIVRVWCRV